MQREGAIRDYCYYNYYSSLDSPKFVFVKLTSSSVVEIGYENSKSYYYFQYYFLFLPKKFSKKNKKNKKKIGKFGKKVRQ